MHALGIRPGDEVITTAHSWISTSETVSQHGAVPVFVDIDPDTYTIDPARIEEKITRRTVGIIPVHLYGQPADMDPIMAIAQRHGLWVIEDCAQAHDATYKGRKVGRFGDAATWSLLSGQESGRDGRCRRDHHRRCRPRAPDGAVRPPWRDHQGRPPDRRDQQPARRAAGGDPQRQAAAISPAGPRARQAVARRYDALLASIAVRIPPVADGREHVYHLYVIEHEDRDGLASASQGGRRPDGDQLSDRPALPARLCAVRSPTRAFPVHLRHAVPNPVAADVRRDQRGADRACRGFDRPLLPG